MEVTISNGTLIKIEEELETSNTNHILPSDVTVQGATKNDYTRDTAFAGSVELTNPTSSMTLTASAPKILARKDLSTLGLTAGTHNIKARARATYYTESADSNVVQYEAISTGYNVYVFNWGGTEPGNSQFFYSTDNGSTWQSVTYGQTGLLVSGASQINFKVIPNSLSMGYVNGYESAEAHYPPLADFLSFTYTSETIIGTNYILSQDIYIDITDEAD